MALFALVLSVVVVCVLAVAGLCVVSAVAMCCDEQADNNVPVINTAQNCIFVIK